MNTNQASIKQQTRTVRLRSPRIEHRSNVNWILIKYPTIERQTSNEIYYISAFWLRSAIEHQLEIQLSSIGSTIKLFDWHIAWPGCPALRRLEFQHNFPKFYIFFQQRHVELDTFYQHDPLNEKVILSVLCISLLGTFMKNAWPIKK